MPRITRQKIISRALPKRSAAAPTNGWITAKVKANTEEKPAAAAIVTPKSSATCGSTGSSARPDSAAEKRRQRDDIERRRQTLVLSGSLGRATV